MKKQNFMSSKNFWMVLAIMLAAFILIAGVILAVANPFKASTPTTYNQQVTVSEQNNPPQDTNHESVKDRVNAINGNYGQGIKDAYSGSGSAVEDTMRQRMFFSGLKSLLICILLGVAVAFVLVKCYTLIFRKKKAGAVDTGEAEISAEEHGSARSSAENKEKKQPKPIKKTQQPLPMKRDTENSEVDTDVSDSDVREVIDGCQLP